jgi:hypothetical protein
LENNLAAFKKKKESVSKDDEILEVLREIRDKLTTRDEQDYSAILSGIVSKIGPVYGGEETAKNFSNLARDLAGRMGKL